VILSPLRLAEQWSLIDPNLNFSYWINELKTGHAKVQNASGDKIQFEAGKDGSLKLVLTGKFLHDGKTELNIQSTWQLTDLKKVPETALKDSLVGLNIEMKNKELEAEKQIQDAKQEAAKKEKEAKDKESKKDAKNRKKGT
jgi:hypothetical protein